MDLYPYRASLAFDPITNTKAANAEGNIYALTDTSFSEPLTPVDANGLAVPLISNTDGILPTFYVVGHPSVNWVSGEYVFPLVTTMPLEGPQGDPGVGVQGVSASGDQMSVFLTDGTELPPVQLPTGVGGSDAGVAGYIGSPNSQTVVALNSHLAERNGTSPKDSGAVGDGVVDDSAAFQEALTEAALSGVLNVPAGTYYMGNTTLTATLAGPLSIQGHGAATLIWDEGSGILLTQNDALHTVTVDGLNLFTRAPGVGVALEIVGTGQNATGANLRPRTRNRGSISGLNVGGATGTATDGWAKGIRLVDIMNFSINRIHIDGYAGPVNGSYVSTHGIEMVTNPANAQAVDVAISQVWVYFVQYALDVQGYEGVLVDQASFIAVGTGFRFDALDAGTPLVTFTNGQIAFINKGFDFTKTNQGVISDSLIYIHTGGGDPNGTGVALHDVTSTRITGCTFVSNIGMRTGVSITGASILNVVEACTFYSTITNPVNLSASTSLNKVHNLTLGSSSQVVINAAGNANDVQYGKSTPAQLQYAPAGAVGQTIDRRTASTASLSALSSGTMHMTAVWLPAGTVVQSATFISGGTPASGFTNRWVALYDSSRNLLRTSADNTTPWLPGTALTIPYKSAYIVTAGGMYYVGICEVATTPTVLRGLPTSPNTIGLAPILNGNGSSGLTNEASTPSTSPALTVSSNLPYAYVS